MSERGKVWTFVLLPFLAAFWTCVGLCVRRVLS